MSPPRQLWSKLTAILLGLLGTLAASLGFYTGFYERAERQTIDFRFRYFNRGMKDSNQLCLVTIDEESKSIAGSWPWPQAQLAGMINLLNELESREILIDFVYSPPPLSESPIAEEDEEEGDAVISEDEVIAQACREQGRVILPFHFSAEPKTTRLYDLLVQNLQLTPEQAARKLQMPVHRIRSSFALMQRLAARQLVQDLLTKYPKLTKREVTDELLGKRSTADSDTEREVHQAFDYVQAYFSVRSKAGWVIGESRLPVAIAGVSECAQMDLPASKLAACCADMGFIDREPDPEGKIREVSLLSFYKGMIYRQLILAGLCQHWQIEPGDFRIGSNAIDLVGGDLSESGNVVLKSTQSNSIYIPLTRQGKLIINWYVPKPGDWTASFKNIIPAGRLMEIAINQKTIRDNQAILANAMQLTVKSLLENKYDRYVKLQRQLPMLRDSVENLPPEPGTTTAPDSPNDPSTMPAQEASDSPTTSQPATTSAPSTIEEDLVSKYRQTAAEISRIEVEARDQLDWLYQQLPGLSPREQSAPDKQLIRKLWQAVNHPEEINRMNAELKALVDQQMLDIAPLVRNRIVLIGMGMSQDNFISTPVFDRCPAMVADAAILNQILQKAFVGESDRNSNLLMILIIGTLMSILAAQRAALEGLLWMLVLLAGFFVFTCIVVFERLHIISSMVGPPVAIVLSWSLVSFYRQMTEGRAKRVLADRLSRYTTPALARKIAEDYGSRTLQAEKRVVTCFSGNLKGFAQFSEKLGPEQTMEFLKIYLDAMYRSLDEHEALVNKIEGDDIVAFFNLPFYAQEDHARRACLSAIDSQMAMAKVEDRIRKSGIAPDHPLHLRIGISTGQAIVGDSGSNRNFEYTCLGRSIDVASGLVKANNFFDTSILIDEATQRQMENDLLARLLGKIRVSEQEEPVVVYELIGYRDGRKDRVEFVNLFEQMVRSYWAGAFDKVPAILCRLAEIQPEDKCIQIYRHLLDRSVASGGQTFRNGLIEIYPQ